MLHVYIINACSKDDCFRLTGYCSEFILCVFSRHVLMGIQSVRTETAKQILLDEKRATNRECYVPAHSQESFRKNRLSLLLNV